MGPYQVPYSSKFDLTAKSLVTKSAVITRVLCIYLLVQGGGAGEVLTSKGQTDLCVHILNVNTKVKDSLCVCMCVCVCVCVCDVYGRPAEGGKFYYDKVSSSSPVNHIYIG